MKTDTENRIELPVWKIVSTNRKIRETMDQTPNGRFIRISAKDHHQAWKKFVHQYFGALKPARKDWAIRKEREV